MKCPKYIREYRKIQVFCSVGSYILSSDNHWNQQYSHICTQEESSVKCIYHSILQLVSKIMNYLQVVSVK